MLRYLVYTLDLSSCKILKILSSPEYTFLIS